MADKSGGRELLMVFLVLNAALSVPGFAYPTKESGDYLSTELLALPFFGFHHQPLLSLSNKAKNCYHFYVAQNMSSLLSDATKMLRQVHDKREREWILTFIYRIKSLAEHLRSHPDSQNYEQCMSFEDEEKKKSTLLSEALRVPQQELYFVDDAMPYQNQKRSMGESEASDATSIQETDEPEKTQENQGNRQEGDQSDANIQQQKEYENFNSVAESTSEAISMTKDVESDHLSGPTIAGTATSELTSSQISGQEQTSESSKEEDDWMIGKGGDDSAIIVSSPQPDCLTQKNCIEVMKRMEDRAAEQRRQEAELERQLHARRRQNAEEERKHQELLKERIRKALLEELAPEIRKFRTVGGTQEDLLKLWKQSENAIMKDGSKLSETDFEYEEEGAAAGDLSSSEKSHPGYNTVAPKNDQVGGYGKTTDVHNDALVQQLYDARKDVEPHYRSTRSLESQNEYLIISTRIPY